MQSLFGPSAKIQVKYADADTRTKATVRVGERDETHYVFAPGESIVGSVEISTSGGRKLEHTGIELELIGQVIVVAPRGARPSRAALSSTTPLTNRLTASLPACSFARRSSTCTTARAPSSSPRSSAHSRGPASSTARRATFSTSARTSRGRMRATTGPTSASGAGRPPDARRRERARTARSRPQVLPPRDHLSALFDERRP